MSDEGQVQANQSTRLGQQQEAFLKEWPLERIEQMTLEEYTNRDRTSFIYWLEFKTQNLGSIKGGSSMKFKVYDRKDRSEDAPRENWRTDGIYAWQGDLGFSPDEAFAVVRPEILAIIQASQAYDLETIEDSYLFGPALKWKIAAMYNSTQIFPVFKLEIAQQVFAYLKPDADQPSRLSDAQVQLRELLADERDSMGRFREILGNLSREERFEGANLDLVDVFPDLDLLSPVLGQKWLAYPSEHEWDMALTVSSILIKQLKLKRNDPRLVINLRESSGRQRFAFMVGGQVLYSLEWKNQDNHAIHRFQVPRKLGAPQAPLMISVGFQPSVGIGQMIEVKASQFVIPDFDIAAMAEVGREECARVSSSRNKQQHVSFLEDIVRDEELHEAFLDYVRAPLEVKMREVYKRILVVRGIQEDLANWKALVDFRDQWDLEAEDFATMKEVLKLDNLMQSGGSSFWKMLWEDPEEAREYFRVVLEESKSIGERIDWAHMKSLALFKARRPEWKTTSQDERTLSVLWSALDLKRHAPYKRSFYKSFCERKATKPKGPRRAYTHYLELLDRFINEFVTTDEQLLTLHQQALGEYAALADPVHHLLAQNVWYKVLDQIWSPSSDSPPEPDENSGKLRNYFIFQSNPSIWDCETALRNGEVTEWNVSRLGSEMKPGDRVILWISGPRRGVYALAEIKTEVRPRSGEDVLGEVQPLGVGLKILENWVDSPVLYDDIADLKIVPSHLQGTNFRSSEEAWNRLLEAHGGERGEPDLVYFEDSFLEGSQIQGILTALRVKKNVILQGPPGTGKTFIARRLAYALMGGKHDDRITTVQFHQSYSYEDFIQGFRPSEDKGFERRNGVFFRFCERARKHPELDHFFIVDEINRGNLSKIFGELMMLIEADKRGPDHQVELTYSAEGETFSIPENVHMIGTMNTADRSLAMVDYALRRRFAFFDIQPAFNGKLRDHLLKNVSAGMADRIIGRLSALNAEIRADGNLGEGFEVGHSYFCHAPAGDEEAWYRHIIEHEVGPQLREYWFDDRAKAEAEIQSLLP